MYHAYIGNQKTNVLRGNISLQLDTIGSFNFDVPASEINSIFSLQFSEVKLYFRDTILIQGIVIDRPSYRIDRSNNIVVNINCSDTLGLLSCEASWFPTNGHYQDTLVDGILTDLITNCTTNWILQPINYAPLIGTVTTIDLRQKENLWGAITAVVESVPNLHVRYGGTDNIGNYILEYGTFNRIIDSANDIVEISLEQNSSKIYNCVYASGGFSASTRVTLQDAINDGRALVHPDFLIYPILTDGNGDLYVANLSITNGCCINKSFDLPKTENTTSVPTQSEINEAGFALWEKTVRFLQKNDNVKTYSLSHLRHELDYPDLGDRIRIDCTVVENIYNEFTGQPDKIVLDSIAEDLKITSASLEFDWYRDKDLDRTHLLNWTLQVTDGDDSQNYDYDVELYDRLSTFDERISDATIKISAPVVVSDSHNGAEASDCSGGGIAAGKLFTFSPINVPTWATNVIFGVSFISPSNALYNLVQVPTVNPDQDLILCAAPSNGNWATLPPASSIYIEVTFTYT